MTEYTSTKIKQLMKANHIGNKALADLSGLPLGTLNKIIYGDTKSPTLDNMQAIARALGCTLDDFVESADEKDPEHLSAEEVSLLAYFRRLNDEGREKILGYASDLVASGRYIKNDSHGVVESA